MESPAGHSPASRPAAKPMRTHEIAAGNICDGSLTIASSRLTSSAPSFWLHFFDSASSTLLPRLCFLDSASSALLPRLCFLGTASSVLLPRYCFLNFTSRLHFLNFTSHLLS